MKRRALIAALAAGIVLASCGGSDSKPKSAPKSAKANGGTSAASPSVPATGPVFPLTGLSDSDGTGATRPVVTVKIPNNNVSPNLRTGAQQGLDQADVVYEEVVDGEITRFLAMFHSKTPERAGPVRSVRPMDPDVVWHVGGIFAYSGGAPNVVPLINAAPVNAVDESEAQASKALFRDRSVSRQTEFTLFANIKTLLTLGGTPAPPPRPFSIATRMWPPRVTRSSRLRSVSPPTTASRHGHGTRQPSSSLAGMGPHRTSRAPHQSPLRTLSFSSFAMTEAADGLERRGSSSGVGKPGSSPTANSSKARGTEQPAKIRPRSCPMQASRFC